MRSRLGRWVSNVALGWGWPCCGSTVWVAGLGAKRGVGAFIDFGLWTLHLLSDWIHGLECAAAAH